MSENNRQNRYELKMVFDAMMIHTIRSWVTFHSSSFTRAFPSRWVNSIYFDTLDLDCYNDHLAGVPIRRKLRFRWYGENRNLIKGHLEVKNKSERSGWKILQTIDHEFDLGKMKWYQIIDKFDNLSTGIVRELIKVSRPVSIIVFFREYYVSANGLVRITIDSDLRVFNQLFSDRPNLIFHQPLNQKLILEIKSSIVYAHLLADVLADFPCRTERYSKYLDSFSWVFAK